MVENSTASQGAWMKGKGTWFMATAIVVSMLACSFAGALFALDFANEGTQAEMHSSCARQGSPIKLESDADFNASYPTRVISGLGIDALAASSCIYIANCSYPFTIENCHLSNGNASCIDIVNCSNATVRNNICEDSVNIGIRISNSHHILVDGNTAMNNTDFGIIVLTSFNVTLTNNTLTGANYMDGIGCAQFDNLTISNNTITGLRFGMVINADWTGHVTRFAITGNEVYNSFFGIYVMYGQNFTIDNNTVAICEAGILAVYSVDVVLDNNTVEGSTSMGTYVGYTQRALIKNSAAYGGQKGFYFLSSSQSKLTGCIAHDNYGDGVYVLESENITIEYNELYSNQNGTYLEHSENIFVENNTMYDNNHGVEGLYANFSEIKYNEIFDSTSSNVYLRYSTYTSASHNVIGYASSYGIRATYSPKCSVTYNNISDTGTVVYFDNSPDGSITNNDIHGDGGENVWVRTSARTIVAFNSIEGGHLTLESSSDSSIISNTISDYPGVGIIVVSSQSVSAAGNTLVSCGIKLSGSTLAQFNTHDITTSNLVNGKPVQYYKNQTSVSAPSNSGQVIFANCSQATVDSIEFYETTYAVSAYYSNNMTFSNVSTYDCDKGIYIYHAQDCDILSCSAQFSGSLNNAFEAYYLDRAVVNDSSVTGGERGLYIYLSSFVEVNRCLFSSYYGIYAYTTAFVTISNCSISETGTGVYSLSSTAVSIEGCAFNGDNIGVCLESSSCVSVMSSTFEGFENNAIYIYDTTDSMFEGNTMRGCSIGVEGYFLEAWNTHTISTTNTVNGKPVYYWKNQTYGAIPSDAGEAILANCSNIQVTGLNISNATQAIVTGYTTATEVSSNVITGMRYGVYSIYCDMLSIKTNEINEGREYDIYQLYSTNLTVSNNEFTTSSGSTAFIGMYSGGKFANNTVYGSYMGADISYCNGFLVSNNSFSSTTYGIYMYFSADVAVANNTVCVSTYGVDIYYSPRVTLSDNIISNSTDYGIYVVSSPFGTFDNTTMLGCGMHFSLSNLLTWTTQDIDTTNTVNGKPVIYIRNQTATLVPHNAGEVILGNCTSMVIDGQAISGGTAGIELGYSRNILVSNCVISDQKAFGIYATQSSSVSVMDCVLDNVTNAKDTLGRGIYLYTCGYSIVEGNELTDCLTGVYLYYGNATVQNNYVNNSKYGMWLNSCKGSTFANNKMLDCSFYLDINTAIADWLTYNIDSTNTANGKPIYYIRNATSGTPPTDAGAIILANCTDMRIAGYSFNNLTAGIILGGVSNIEIDGNTIENTSLYGIIAYYGNDDSITNNTLAYGLEGLYLLYSDNNIVAYNTFCSFSEYALNIRNSHYNVVHHNNFISSHNVTTLYNESNVQARDYNDNMWNDISEGNFWSDLTTPDADADGIVDVPYKVDSLDSYDNYPLAKPYGAAMQPVANITSILPNPAYVGQDVNFACAASQLFGSIVAYNWTSNVTGLLSNNASFSTTALPIGTHTITLTVTNSYGVSSVPVTRTLVIVPLPVNIPPTASITSITPNPAIEGQVVTFTGTGSDADGTITAYRWYSNISGDLSTLPVFSTSSLPAGTHLITLNVTDDNGMYGEATMELVISAPEPGTNVPPTASITSVTPNPAIEGQSISFVGSATDIDGTVTSYLWSSNISGNLSSSASFSNASLPAGAHLITFVAQDNNGSWSAAATITLVINPYVPGVNVPPSSSITSITPNPATEGQDITFVGSASDFDGTVTAYNWTSSIDGKFGDQATVTNGSLSVGTHTISFAAQDDNGSWSTPSTAVLVVNAPVPNNAPSASITNITPSPADTGQVITFTGIGSDTDGTITAYNWTSSISGMLSALQTFTCSTLPAGTHTITLTVCDDDGAWSAAATATLTINVAVNVKPTAKIMSITPSPAKNGKDVTFVGAGNDTDGTISEYKWTSSIDGLIGSAATFTTKSLSAGTHTISFSVKDDDGEWSDAVTATLEVKKSSTQPAGAPMLPIMIALVAIIAIVIVVVLLMMRKKPTVTKVERIEAPMQPPMQTPEQPPNEQK